MELGRGGFGFDFWGDGVCMRTGRGGSEVSRVGDSGGMMYVCCIYGVGWGWVWV